MTEREIAVFTFADIVLENGYNNIVLRKTLNAHNELNTVQKAFITQLVNGTLRNMINIDYIIDKFSKTPTRKMKPLILNILRIGVYQIMYMDKVPVSAACNEAVKIAKAHGFKSLSGFVNGVLRNIARNKDNIEYPKKDSKEYISVKYSYPMWIIDYWLENYSLEQIKNICIANNRSPHISICVNTNKITKQELVKKLRAEGIEADANTNLENSIYISKTNNISKTKCYQQGLFHIIDESSMLAITLLNPAKGSDVVDVCAAPGGKSFCSGYIMQNEGSIISRDIHSHKVQLISDGIKRLGLDCIHTEVKDAMSDDDTKVDFVIVDAPCSGLGLAGKKPDIKYNKTMDDIDSLVDIQRQILTKAQSMVKKNGKLLYSTCTISHKENVDNMKWFISNYDFEPVDLTSTMPNGLNFETAKDGYVEITPDKMLSDGFFIAVLRRK